MVPLLAVTAVGAGLGADNVEMALLVGFNADEIELMKSDQVFGHS